MAHNIPQNAPGDKPVFKPRMKTKHKHGGTVLKAYGGDRRRNLEEIANEIDRMFPPDSCPTGIEGDENIEDLAQRLHKLRGYAEQLRIIAAELPTTPTTAWRKNV